jgi:ubiquinone/menaquinone biosynthesis C-methylase UbiE
MKYVDFTAFIQETNRPPGGKHSIRTIAQNAFIDSSKNVLEIGCNTGFTSIELVKTTGCSVHGVDVNEKVVKYARSQAEQYNCSDKVTFSVADACSLPFKENTFDIVVTGGANAWISNRKSSLMEYKRVLKDWGFLCTVPFYYRFEPPNELIDDLNRQLGISIQKWDRNFWINLFESAGYESYYLQPEVATRVVEREELNTYADYIAGRLFSKGQTQLFNATKEKLLSYWLLFNENNKYLAYSVMIFRKRDVFPEMTIFD